MFSGFMENAWIAGTIVAVIGGVVGFFVVLRGSAFPAHAIPKGAFAGAAGANLLGLNTLFGLGVFSLLAALGIGVLGRRGRHDVVTALALVVMLALGAVFLSRSVEYEPEVFALLFGQILGVSSTEIAPLVGLAVASICLVAVVYRPLVLASVLPDSAAIQGVAPYWMEIVFLVIVAAATTVTLPVVGALLIFSLMIGPPAAARSLTSRPALAILFSVAIAVACLWGALACAYTTNWPVGFWVGTLSAAAYGMGRLFALGERSRRIKIDSNVGGMLASAAEGRGV